MALEDVVELKKVRDKAHGENEKLSEENDRLMARRDDLEALRQPLLNLP